MNGRTTLLLLLTALGLGAWIALTERDGVRRGPAGDVGFRRIDPAEVVSVELLRSNLVLRADRTNGGWWLRAPVDYPARDAAVETLVQALGDLAPKTRIDGASVTARPGTLAAFGLETPETITVRSRSGLAILLVGGRTASGRDLYFQRVGEDGVFTADAALLNALPGSPDAWRDRRLFDADTVAFDRIEVGGATEFEAVRSTNGAWSLVRPLQARANGDQINRLIVEVGDATATAFVTDSAAAVAEDYGLARPTAEMVLRDGAREVLRLRVGRAETNAPGEVFVRRSPPGNIVRVKNSLASALRQPLAAFRDRRLLPGIAGTTRLEVRDGTNRFALEREGTNWFVASGVRRPADAVWVRETLRRMVALQIAEFVNDLATDPVRYGLSEPAREYVFTGPGASSNEVRTVAALAFGTPYAEGQRVYVRRSDEPGVYGLPMADFVVLPRSPAQFRDWKIDPTNVVRVEIRHRGATRVLLRDAAGRWQGRGMPPGALTDPAIDEGLYRLGQSAAGRFPAPDGAALKQFGFELVDHAVTVIQREGGPFRTLELRFGGRPNAVNQFVLARFDDEETPVLTEFPLRLYQEFVGPWFGIAPPAGPDVRRP